MYNDDGSLYIPFGSYAQGSYSNPVPIQSTSASSKTGNVLLSADVSYEIIKGLRAKMLISYTLQDNEYHMYYPSTAISAQTQDSYPNPYATHTTNTYSALNIEPMLTYDTKISKGALSLLAGGTWLDRNNSMTAIQVQNPGSDALLNSYANGNPTIANNNEYYYKFNSIFGRATYNWNSKYLVNVTYRRDGSSRFGPENKFGNFGSAGLGWIFSEEKFISNTLSFLSFGKLRGSYGTTGSDNIGDYKYTSLLESDPYSIYVGQDPLAPAGVPNPEVQWEKTTKLDIGIELGFFKNRILLNTTWYRTSSDNLLVDKELPSQTGYFGYTGNFEGTIQNTGMEFQLTTQNLAPGKKLTWKTSFNISFNENILTEFPGLEDSYYKDSYEIGRAIPSGNDLLEMPYNFTGIDPATGLPQFKDLNEDGIINYLDSFRNAAWIGTALPTTWGGLGNYFTYKGFGFDFFIQFSNKTMTAWNFYGTANGRMMNPSEDLTGNYWKQPGDETKYPRLYTGVPGKPLYTDPILRQYPYSSANLVRGTYYRLKNVQFTYTVPANILQSKGVENLMFYIRGENLAVYTKHKIYKDPELFWNNAIPMLRTFIAGVQLTF
jgi:TonB-linked SusC/RagA family outer membrane protein